MGTHRCLRAAADLTRRHDYVLRLDLAKFFPSIDHAILETMLHSRTPRPWWPITQRILDAPCHVEPTRFYFPGDDLFTPISRPHGLPIGNLTSQVWANLMLTPIDHLLACHLNSAASSATAMTSTRSLRESAPDWPMPVTATPVRSAGRCLPSSRSRARRHKSPGPADDRLAPKEVPWRSATGADRASARRGAAPPGWTVERHARRDRDRGGSGRPRKEELPRVLLAPNTDVVVAVRRGVVVAVARPQVGRIRPSSSLSVAKYRCWASDTQRTARTSCTSTRARTSAREAAASSACCRAGTEASTRCS
jgi:hypothetical protein